MLEWAVSIDPRYAPAWEALGQRYDFDSTYGGGGEESFQKSNTAFERAVTIDPNRVMAASSLITNRVERGDLGRAYEAATDLVRRRPQSADAHFALSYVLRYAGMLTESEEVSANQRADSIRATLPSARARGPSWKWEKRNSAMDFVHLDAGSEWEHWVTPYVHLAEGNVAEARNDTKNMGKSFDLPSRTDGSMHRASASCGHGENRARGRILRDRRS